VSENPHVTDYTAPSPFPPYIQIIGKANRPPAASLPKQINKTIFERIKQMNFVSKARTTAIATIAAIGVIAGSAAIAPTEAQAGNGFANGLIGGLIVGGIVAASNKNYYGGGHHAAPVYQSCHTRWETRYNSHGHAYSVKVQYCN
jgi:hypothetical protein